MFNPTELIIDGFIQKLQNTYLNIFSNMCPDHPGIINSIARMTLERIADSDALYHNVEHTIMVTLVGQEIMRGKHIKEGQVTPEDWLHFLISLLCHDIGYVRGVCLQDTKYEFVTDDQGGRTSLPLGASDAALTSYHVDRGRIFVRERFCFTSVIDVERVVANIELTRFPVPNNEDHMITDDYPGLIRAADLIGQLSDPHYMRKINALYQEFYETGTAAKLGYTNPAELAKEYSCFFWNAVHPYIADAMRYLHVTQEGKQWIANLYAHVFAAEHHEHQLGPQRLRPT